MLETRKHTLERWIRLDDNPIKSGKGARAIWNLASHYKIKISGLGMRYVCRKIMELEYKLKNLQEPAYLKELSEKGDSYWCNRTKKWKRK